MLTMDPAGVAGKRLMLDRSHVLKWTRPDLEDKFLKLYDDFLHSKQELNSKTAECKRLRGQLTKLKPRHATESMVTEGDRVEQLERENILLRDKLKSLSYQIKAYTSKVQPPHAVRGNAYRAASHKSLTPKLKPVSLNASHRMQIPLPEEEVAQSHKRAESTELLRAHIHTLETENINLKREMDKMQQKFEFDYEKMKEDLIGNQKIAVTENVEMIKLQKQMNEKTAELVLCQLKLKKLEQEHEIIKSTKDAALNELNQCLESLRHEKMASYDLERENLKLKSLTTIGVNDNKREMATNEADIENLRRENEILKQTNEVLKSNAFKVEHLVEYSTMEKTLQSKVSHLETIIKSEESVKNETLEKLNQEIKLRTKAEEITNQLESKLIKQNLEVESLKSKLDRLSLGNGFKEEDIVEALALLRQQKQLAEQFPNDPTMIEKNVTRVNQKLQELEIAYAETCRELDKVRAMLVSQHQISKKYELEIENLQNNLDSKEKEISDKTKRHMQWLDERSMKIQKLESALRNIAYGSKSTTILQAGSTPESNLQQEIFLEPGQIMLYLKITKVTLTDDALAIMKSSKPEWFLTMEFYDFDLQFTPVACRTELALDYTFYYVVTASDLFVRYLQTGFLSMEFHQVAGEKYRTLAVGRIELKDLLVHKAEINGVVHLDAILPENVGTIFGNVLFTIKFGSPLEDSIKSYKARLKALGFLNDGTDRKLDHDSDQLNELHIYVHRCRGLKGSANQPPSPYVVYGFLDFPDAETQIVRNSRDPEFEAHKVFPIKVRGEAELLKNYILRFYIFDDSAGNEKDGLLGVVLVDLSPLAENKPIRGSFPLKSANNQECGTLDLSIAWKFTPIEQTLQKAAQEETVVASKHQIDQKEERNKEISAPSEIAEETRIEEFYEKLEDTIADGEKVNELMEKEEKEQEEQRNIPKPKPRLMSLRPS